MSRSFYFNFCKSQIEKLLCLLDFKWTMKFDMPHLNKYKNQKHINHQSSSICLSYRLCNWKLHDSFVQFYKDTMSIFHQGINRWKMILFLNHDYINQLKNFYHINFNNECFSLNIWFIQKIFYHLDISSANLINEITIKKYSGTFSVEMRANFNKCLSCKFNYHSVKNLHFSNKIFLIINVIFTETIHNHFMRRRKLEQQNKVNYPT